MMRRIAILLGATLCAPATFAGGGEYTADAYATCSACHLPDGAGVPGAFPPVRNRAAAIAALEGGRDYLVRVVSFGLMGTIQVDGVQFFGVMAGNSAAMSAEELAAALNYVVFELNDGDAAGIEPFTTAEVERIQAETSVKSPTGAGEQRRELQASYGEQWP